MHAWDLVCIGVVSFFHQFFFSQDRLLGKGDTDLLKGGPTEGKNRCYVPPLPWWHVSVAEAALLPGSGCCCRRRRRSTWLAPVTDRQEEADR